jgi:cation:H+ antiporter
VFVPYVGFLVLKPTTVARLPLPAAVTMLLGNAAREAALEGMDLEAELEGVGPATPQRGWWPVALVAPALAAIVVGSIILVQSALTLGSRWGVPTALVGVVALAAATSLPNAYAAVRLAMDGRGAAVVSATFNSNTLNLVAGIAVPLLLFPTLRESVPASYIVWLVAMSLVALALLARGLRRGGAVLLLGAYAAFVAYAVLTA